MTTSTKNLILKSLCLLICACQETCAQWPNSALYGPACEDLFADCIDTPCNECWIGSDHCWLDYFLTCYCIPEDVFISFDYYDYNVDGAAICFWSVVYGNGEPDCCEYYKSQAARSVITQYRNNFNATGLELPKLNNASEENTSSENETLWNNSSESTLDMAPYRMAPGTENESEADWESRRDSDTVADDQSEKPFRLPQDLVKLLKDWERSRKESVVSKVSALASGKEKSVSENARGSSAISGNEEDQNDRSGRSIESNDLLTKKAEMWSRLSGSRNDVEIQDSLNKQIKHKADSSKFTGSSNMKQEAKRSHNKLG